MQHRYSVGWTFALASCLALVGNGLLHGQASNFFTVQIGAATAPPVTLVNHTDNWSYRRGTNAPQADWRTAADSGLDATWTVAPGGFGYGDAGIVGESTTVNISNVCNTLYIRRAFTVGSQPDTNAHLQLVVDYDDGFVAYLDGQELTRSNLTSAAGTFVANTDLSGPSHEASCCDSGGHAAETFDVGAVGSRLAPGEHVLAIIAVNQARTSSDLHIIADLRLTSASSGGINGALLSVVATNSVQISGSNTVAGSMRVVVNGDDASFNLAQGTWSTTVALAAGVNQLAIQALDATGHILAATNRLVVANLGGITTGGVLATNTIWSSSNGLVRLTNTVVVPAGGSLTIEEGVVVQANANCSLRATNAAITALGTAGRRIYFLPADGSTSSWGGLIVTGTNALLHLQQAETVACYVEILNGATGILEDSTLRDYLVASPPILHTLGDPNQVTLRLRRCHITRYHEVLCQMSTNLIEGCLLEYQDYSGDGIDFDGGQPGSFIRRTTVRRGTIFNTDALDMGEYNVTGEPSRGVLIDSCLLHDFIDKGVSMGVQVDITVSNCVIYNVESGIAVKDLSTAGIYNNTITEAGYGFNCYNKASSGATNGGGLITNAVNNILWQFSNTTLSLRNGSTLEANYNDLANTNWPGAGSISVDPLFLDPARHNYRLATNSPLLTAGTNGTAMGAAYPVGGIPGTPWNLAALTLATNQITLAWLDDADNEDGFEIQRSTDRVAWETISITAADAITFGDASLTLDQRYYYRVRATNDLGVSAWSSLAGAVSRVPDTSVRGPLAGNTVWSGTVLVSGTVTVPTGVTLTVLPGTVIKMTNAASISAQAGGTIDIQGAFTNRVLFQPWTSNGTWGTINASGNNSFLSVRHAELDHGGINFGSQATGIVEDSYVHDVYSAIVANSARSATVRRTHVRNFSETIYNSTPVIAEDLLLEDMTASDSDALEIQGAAAAWGCIVRRVVARHSTGSNSDAIDFNGSSGILLEDCVVYDFTDKGVSMGASGQGGSPDYGITIRNCLIYKVDTGIAVKDGSTVSLSQTTIAGALNGMRLYQKYTSPVDGGHVTNGFNNILWGNTNSVLLQNNSSLALNYSVVQGTNWPGVSNLELDPLFTNAAVGDYQLATGSPCIGTGSNGLNMGVTFPVGLYILNPDNLAATVNPNSVALSWRDNSVSESVYELERSINGGDFSSLAILPADTTNFVDTGIAMGNDYRYRVRGRSIVAESGYSVEARATLWTAPQLTLASSGGIGLGTNGWFGLQFTAPANINVVLEASTNLQTWLPVQTNGTGAGQVELYDPASTNFVQRFYRIQLLP